MKKQAYIKPAMRVVRMQHQGIICTTSTTVSRNSNNVGLKEEIYGGNGTARSRNSDYWDDEYDEDNF
jgi:hypothetical protein